MKIEEFSNLVNSIPEGANSSNLEVYFDQFLSVEYLPSETLDMYEILFQLSDKQWHSYEYLAEHLSKRIGDWISKNQLSDYEYYELVAAICANIGLNETYQKLLGSKYLAINYPSLFLEIKKDFGKDVTEIYNNLSPD